MTSLPATVNQTTGNCCRDIRILPNFLRHPLRLSAVLIVTLLALFFANLIPSAPRLHISLRWRNENDNPVVDVSNRLRYRIEVRNDSIDAQILLYPDFRSQRCLDIKYRVKKLQQSTTLIVHFNDYKLYDAEVTLTSVFHNSDPVDRQILVEIILVDVGSSLKHVQTDAESYVRSLKRLRQTNQHLPPVRLLRVEKLRPSDENRQKWWQVAGAKVAKTDVVVFVDPGVVVGRGWLAPLVYPLVTGEKRDSSEGFPEVVESHLDRLRSLINLKYRKTSDDLIPVPSWSLSIRMRRVPLLEDDDRISNGSSELESPLYRPIPAFRGNAFALRTSDFHSIGGLFDDLLDVFGGGEYLELSFRIWMCGHGIKQALCSRVGVPDLDDEVRVVSPPNARRITDVWLADRKSLVRRSGGTLENDLAAAGDNEEDVEQRPNDNDSGIQDAAKNSKKCRNFEWYLKNAALGTLISPFTNSSWKYGFLQVKTDRCAKIGVDRRIDLVECTSDRSPQPNSVFELTSDRQILQSATGRCLTVNTINYVIVDNCKQPLDKSQTWQYNDHTGELTTDLSGFCATHVTDPDPNHKGRQIMMAQKCSQAKDNNQDKFKRWHFTYP